MRHQFGNLLLRIGGEADVAVGQDADQLAGHALGGAGHHRNAGEAVVGHQRQGVAQQRVGADGQRIDHHAGFVLLHLANLRRLAVDVEIAVDHPDAAGLRHRDRHPGFGHGVHRRGDDRGVERDRAGDAGADIGLGGQDVGQTRLQQHVIERECFAKPGFLLKRHRQLHSAAQTPRCPGKWSVASAMQWHRRRIDAHQWGLARVDSMGR